jgi:hypothetical protein
VRTRDPATLIFFCISGFRIAACAPSEMTTEIFQQPALMFAFKGRRTVFYSAAALSRGGAQFFTPPPRTAPIIGAHSRRQDFKTPVKQALMRGLGAA